MLRFKLMCFSLLVVSSLRADDLPKDFKGSLLCETKTESKVSPVRIANLGNKTFTIITDQDLSECNRMYVTSEKKQVVLAFFPEKLK